MVTQNWKMWIAVATVAVAGGAAAQQPGMVKADLKVAQASPNDARCRKDVKDYVETIRLLRETAGNDTGNLVTGAFIPEADLERVAQTQGPCAAAQILREKRATR